MAAGPSRARPAACTTRATTSRGSVGAAATKTDPTPSRPTPARNIRRRPYRSDIHPQGTNRAVSVMAKALSTHEVAAGPAPKSRSISPNDTKVTE